MKSTSSLPTKSQRGICTRCGITAPLEMLMGENAGQHVCRNVVACTKRQQRIPADVKAAADRAAAALTEPTPPKGKRRRDK